MESAELRNATQTVNQSFVSAFERRDASGMAAVYTETAEILPPNVGIISGRAGIQKFWEGVLNMGLTGARLETVEMEGEGDSAYEVGKFELTVQGGQVADYGKYIVIWKREQGRWKWHRDIFNSSKRAA